MPVQVDSDDGSTMAVTAAVTAIDGYDTSPAGSAASAIIRAATGAVYG